MLSRSLLIVLALALLGAAQSGAALASTSRTPTGTVHTVPTQPSPTSAPTPSPFYPNCPHDDLPLQSKYRVTVTRRDVRPDMTPLVSHGKNSVFTFNFASAWFPPPAAASAGGVDGLVVRVVECNPDHHSCANTTHQEWSNAGALAVIAANLSSGQAEPIGEANIIWPGMTPPPPSNRSEWGLADPRMAYWPAAQRYFLTADNCTHNCGQRYTMLMSTTNPFDHHSWQLHGPLLPGRYTAGAALLFREQPPHYAYIADSNTAHVLNLLQSQDGFHWTEATPGTPFMSGRKDCWDQAGVAAGAQPEKLSDGNYFMTYNIDTGYPYHPQRLGRCAMGWAVLNGSDPSQIVARSDDALLIASLPWETCASTGKGYTCQEPMVIFDTGLKPMGGDKFIAVYGAADTDVGAAEIQVEVR